MPMASPLRVGLIGLGRMGARIAAAAERAGMQVVAALDASAEPYALGERPELRAVLQTDAERFWGAGIDLLVVATTAPSHLPLLEQGLQRGIRRFLIEKPFATGLAEARRVLAEADRLGARVVVNHGRRYSRNHQALAALSGSAEMGDLRTIMVSQGGGSLGCIGVHVFDLAIQLMGARPEKVFAQLTTPLSSNPRGSQFDDPGGSAILSFPGGRRALIDMGDDIGVLGTTECRFAKGRVLIETDGAPWTLLRRKSEDRDLPLTRYGQPLEQMVFPGFRPYDVIDYAQAALEDAAGSGAVQAGPEVALGSLEVYAAIRWSARMGQAVTLPLPAEAEEAVYCIP